jgi:putative phosphoesterase
MMCVRTTLQDWYGSAVATLGVISDTHGLLRPEARAVLASVDRIIHAGDIDDRQTLQWLSTMGEVTVVRGNCDRGSWASALPDHDLITIEGFSIYVVHDPARITVDPKAAGIAAVVCGHTHQPKSEMLDGVLHFNPGSAGPRRYGRPVSLGKLHVGPGGVLGEIILLA